MNERASTLPLLNQRLNALEERVQASSQPPPPLSLNIGARPPTCEAPEQDATEGMFYGGPPQFMSWAHSPCPIQIEDWPEGACESTGPFREISEMLTGMLMAELTLPSARAPLK